MRREARKVAAARSCPAGFSHANDAWGDEYPALVGFGDHQIIRDREDLGDAVGANVD
jgi:hypothetical protein